MSKFFQALVFLAFGGTFLANFAKYEAHGQLTDHALYQPIMEIDFYQTDYCPFPCDLGTRVNSSLCGCTPIRTHEELLYNYVEFRDIVLRYQNSFRNLIASGKLFHPGTGTYYPPASNMMALSYNLELEYGARCWAMRIGDYHDKCRSVAEFQNIGQNLGFDAASKKMQTDVYPMSMEHHDYKPEWIKSFRGEVITPDGREVKIGHFTQLAWGTTYQVGCARAFIPGGERKPLWRWTELCNYASLGDASNKDGEPVYLEGEPCSRCPEGIGCSKQYKYLCGEEVHIKYPVLSKRRRGKKNRD